MAVDPQTLIQDFSNIQQNVLSVSSACETLFIAAHAMESTDMYKCTATAKAHSAMKAALQTYMTNAERIMRQTTRDGAEGVLNDLVQDIETIYSQPADRTAHEQVRLTSTAFNSFVSVSNELVSDADIEKHIKKVKAAIASDRARGGRLATGVSAGTFVGSFVLGVITVPASAAAATPVLCGIAMVGLVVAIPALTISAGTWIYQSCTTTKATRAACDRLTDVRTSLTTLHRNLQIILRTISSLLVNLAEGTRAQLHAQFAGATAGSAQMRAILQAIEAFQGGVQAASRAALSLHHIHS